MKEYAVVRYPSSASRPVKVAALYAGLETIALRLRLDFMQPQVNVEAGLERARVAASECDGAAGGDGP